MGDFVAKSMAATATAAGDGSVCGSVGGGVPADLRATFAAHGQDHVFKYVDSGAVKAGSDEISAFVSQLRTIDPARMNQLHLSTTGAAAAVASNRM